MPPASYKCPHCGVASFTFDDVRALGPAFSVTCRSCQRKASISGLSTLLFVAVGLAPSAVLGLFLIGVLGSTPARDARLAVAGPLLLAGVMMPLATRLYYAKLRLAKR